MRFGGCLQVMWFWLGSYSYGFNGRHRLVQARVEMGTIPKAGLCVRPSCCELGRRETRASDRPPLAVGLQLVHSCWKVPF